MRRWARWLAMAAGTVAAFALTWSISTVVGLGLEWSLSLAGLAIAIVAVPLGTWAGRQRPADDTATAASIGPGAPGIGAVYGGVVAGPGSTITVSSAQAAPITSGEAQSALQDAEPATQTGAGGQVVVGEIPREPVAFQPREELARRLAETAASDRVAVVCAVTGARGVGKTQLAAAYVRSQVERGCPVVAWITAEDSDQALAGLGQLAARLGLRDPEDDSAAAAARVRQWLEGRQRPCLLVFDNVTDPEVLAPYLPATGQARIIVTSTRQSVQNLGQLVEVEAFTPAEAVAFLGERTGLDDEPQALELAGEVGYLPLALAQVAAVIRSQRLPYATYLERLRRFPLEEYLTRPSGDPYPRGAAEAILLALTEAERDDTAGLCRPLLDLLAVLSPAGVDRGLLHMAAGDDLLTAGSGAGGEDGEVRVDAALARLADASLVTLGPNESVSMHRLTQRVVRDRDNHDGGLAMTLGAAAQLLGTRLIPEAEEGPWRYHWAAEEVLKQITAVWEAATTYPGPLAPPAQPGEDASDPAGEPSDLAILLLWLRRWTVAYLINVADPARALPLSEAVSADHEHLRGDDHPDTLDSRSYLASVYHGVGQLEEAITLLERMLADRERVLGGDHPETLGSRNSLATAYRDAGRLEEAIDLHERTLAAAGQQFGDDHPDTLGVRNSLAVDYRRAGRLEEAIALLERILVVIEQRFGDDRPDSIISRNNLAYAYRDAGRLEEATALNERTLADGERTFGADHPLTLALRNNLATIYRGTGRLEEAIDLHEHTLADFERVLGADHPDTLGSRHDLASAYEDAGRMDEAMALYEQTLAARERALGAEHPDTCDSRHNLAVARARARPRRSIFRRLWPKRRPDHR